MLLQASKNLNRVRDIFLFTELNNLISYFIYYWSTISCSCSRQINGFPIDWSRSMHITFIYWRTWRARWGACSIYNLRRTYGNDRPRIQLAFSFLRCLTCTIFKCCFHHFIIWLIIIANRYTTLPYMFPKLLYREFFFAGVACFFKCWFRALFLACLGWNTFFFFGHLLNLPGYLLCSNSISLASDLCSWPCNTSSRNHHRTSRPEIPEAYRPLLLPQT